MSIFLSYSEEDAPLVHRIFLIFDRMRLAPYAYELFEESGEMLDQLIPDRIKESEIFIPFITHAGVLSHWVNQEIGVARGLNKTIVPIKEEGIDEPGFIKFRVYIPYYPYDPDETIYRLIRRVYSLLKSKPDAIHLQCKCGNEVWAAIPPPREIDRMINQDLVNIWTCNNCGRGLTLLPKTLEQLPQLE